MVKKPAAAAGEFIFHHPLCGRQPPDPSCSEGPGRSESPGRLRRGEIPPMENPAAAAEKFIFHHPPDGRQPPPLHAPKVQGDRKALVASAEAKFPRWRTQQPQRRSLSSTTRLTADGPPPSAEGGKLKSRTEVCGHEGMSMSTSFSLAWASLYSSVVARKNTSSNVSRTGVSCISGASSPANRWKSCACAGPRAVSR